MDKTVEKIFKEVLCYVSQDIFEVLKNIPTQYLNKIEEIRLRSERPLIVHNYKVDYFLDLNGNLTRHSKGIYITKYHDLLRTLELMSRNSIYAFQDEIKNGFLTLSGGHRVGIAGRVILAGSEIKNLKDISGLNIRIAKEVIGCAEFLTPYLYKSGEICSTLLVSPPQCGKTTMLRDMARIISDGNKAAAGCKVGIVDERSEIAACSGGIPQYNVGIRTDVMDACPKSIGLPLIVRTMSPDVIITDELGSTGDSEAVGSVMNAGVKIIASAHGYNISNLKIRKEVLKLINNNVFERYVVLSNKLGPGTIEEIIDGDTMKPLFRRVSNVS